MALLPSGWPKLTLHLMTMMVGLPSCCSQSLAPSRLTAYKLWDHLSLHPTYGLPVSLYRDSNHSG